MFSCHTLNLRGQQLQTLSQRSVLFGQSIQALVGCHSTILRFLFRRKIRVSQLTA
jgi:hypothetical protein